MEKIVSGGQTGADRAALEWAIAHNIPHGGWCPKGRMAEDGEIPRRYDVKETTRADYLQRTEWNVRDSDGTVIFSISDKLSRGSKATAKFADELGKPCLHLSAKSHGNAAVALLRAFVLEFNIKVLNVAGPRASNEPNVAVFVRQTLNEAFYPVQSTEKSSLPIHP